MATGTTNYGLKKPDAEDFYNVEDFNENFDKVDAAMQELKEARPDWNERDRESLKYIKNLPLKKVLYSGEFEEEGNMTLTNSALAYRFIEFQGEDGNGVWSERVSADSYAGQKLKIHGFTAEYGFSSGPNINFGLREGYGIIKKVIGIDPNTSRIDD